MCLAIHKIKGVVLDVSFYENGFKRNDHGGGFAYVGQNKKGQEELIVRKGFMNLQAMLAELLPLEKEHEMLIHFRKSSCGGIAPDMCHPFAFESTQFPQYSFAMIHNGTLGYPSTLKKSDTYCFTEDLLFPHLDRDPYFFDSASGMWMMEEIIGSNNKFVIMRYDSEDKETKVYVVNRKQGVELKGCWFSNSSYLPQVVYVAPVYTPGYWGGNPENGAIGGIDSKPWERKDALAGWKKDENGRWSGPSGGQGPTRPFGGSIIATMIAKVKKACSSGGTDGPKQVTGRVRTALELLDERMARENAAVNDTDDDVDPGAVVNFPSEHSENWEDYKPTVVVDLQGKAIVEVPRDPDVLSEEAWKKQAEAAKPHMTKRGTDIQHLTKSQKRKMCRLTIDYLKGQNIQSVHLMGLVERVIWMREDIRFDLDFLNDYTDEQLDSWILQKVEDLEQEFKAEKEAKRAEMQEKASLEKQEAKRMKDEMVGQTS